MSAIVTTIIISTHIMCLPVLQQSPSRWSLAL